MTIGLRSDTVNNAAAVQVNGADRFTINQDGYAYYSGMQSWRNRLINGDMRIDQRNSGASVSTATGLAAYVTDRWLLQWSQTSKLTAQQNQGSVTPPIGFSHYLGFTSSSSYSVAAGDYFIVQQRIEGVNVSDLAWGTANAKSVTLSLQVRSSLTGTFGGSITNYAGTLAYPFTYTINSANTWETKSITIAGPTSGTWPTDTSGSLIIFFGLGCGSNFSAAAGAWGAGNIFSATGTTSVVGTNGATFYITGVQLEKGTIATPYEYVEYGEQLRRCQRYCHVVQRPTTYVGNGTFHAARTSSELKIYLPVTLRSTGAVNSGVVWSVWDYATGTLLVNGTGPTAYTAMFWNGNLFTIQFTGHGNGTAGGVAAFNIESGGNPLIISAEL